MKKYPARIVEPIAPKIEPKIEPVAEKGTAFDGVINALIDSASATIYAGQRMEKLSVALDKKSVIRVQIHRDGKGVMKELVITRPQ